MSSGPQEAENEAVDRASRLVTVSVGLPKNIDWHGKTVAAN